MATTNINVTGEEGEWQKGTLVENETGQTCEGIDILDHDDLREGDEVFRIKIQPAVQKWETSERPSMRFQSIQ